MAINNYDGTNLGALANSGYFRRFFSEFADDAGQAWRVEILDNTTTTDGFSFSDSDPQGFRLGPDGCTLDWSGKGDTMHDPFIESTLTLDFLLEGTRRQQLKTELSKGLENRFAVGLFKHIPHPINSSTSTTEQDTTPAGYWVPEWFGVIQPDGVQSLTNEPLSFLRITAVDGLGLLNQKDFLQLNGQVYDDEATLAKTIGRCLEKLPTFKLWGWPSYNGTTTQSTTVTPTSPVNRSFFREYVHNYDHDAHLLEINPVTFVKQSPLYNTAILSPTFYKSDESTDNLGGLFIDKKGMTCGKVLHHILQVFQARLFLSGGEWHFMNPGAVNHSESDTDTPPTFCYATGATMLSGNGPVSHTMPTVVVDINGAKIEPLSGLTDSYLHPVKLAMSKHIKGGSTVVLQAPPGAILNSGGGFSSPGSSTSSFANSTVFQGPPEFYPYYIFPHDGPFTNIKNVGVNIPNGSQLTIKGEILLSETGRHNNSITEPDGIGLKAVFEIIIKVGPYYLKRNLTHSGSSESIEIHRNLQSNLDYSHLKQSGVIEWTTVPSSYSFVMPTIGNDPEAPIVTQGSGDTAVDIVGGLHTANRGGENEHQFKHRSGLFGSGTEVNKVNHVLDWTLPDLPDISAGFDGVEFTVYLDYYKYDGTNLDYSDTSFLQLPIPARINNFRMLTGDGGDGDQDAFFSASNVVNSSELWASKSVLGDQYEGQLNGVLLTNDVNTATDYVPGGERWRCRAGENGPNAYIHQLNAEQLARHRYKPTLIRTGTYAFDPSYFLPPWNQITYKTLPRFNDLWAFTMSETEVKCVPLSLTWTIKSRVFDIEAMAVDYESTHVITSDDNVRHVKGSNTSGTTGVPGAVSVQASIINSTGGNATNVPSGFNFTKFNFDDYGLTSLIVSSLNGENRVLSVGGLSSINLQTFYTQVKRVLIDIDDYDGHVKVSGPLGKTGTPKLQIFRINPDASNESTEAVSIAAPSNLSSSYDIILPRSAPSQALAVMSMASSGQVGTLVDGTNGQVLTANGSGGLSWQTPAAGGSSDGWHGSATLLKVMPNEFFMNDDYTRAPIAIEDDTTRVLGVRLPATGAEMYAFLTVPTGYKATQVRVYSSASTTNAVDIFSFNHTTGATASKGTGDLGALIDITDVSSSTTDNLVIKVSPNSSTSVIYGADISITTI